MRWIMRIGAGLLACAVSGVGHAATPVDEAAVLRDTLPNGLRVVIVRDALTPMVATRLVYLAGSAQASADFPGTAHAVEHMMFRGTRDLDANQLNRIIQATGGMANAMTGVDYTQYLFNVAPADLGVILRVEADRMRGIALAPDQWARERGAIEQEVSADRSSPGYRAAEQFNAALFAGTPYAWRGVGTRESFDATDIDRLKQFHDAWYAPNNAVLLIVGDVVPQATLAMVRADFADIPRRTLPRPAKATAVPPLAAHTLSASTDSGVGTVQIGWRVPGLRDPDTATRLILADAINNRRGALGRLSVEGRGLGAFFSYSGRHDWGQAVATIRFPRGGDPARYLADLQAVLADFRAHGVPPAQVEAAKRARVKNAAFDRNSIPGLTQTWLTALVERAVSDPDALVRQYAAVTPAAVDALVKRELMPEQALIQVDLPTDHIAPAHDSGFGGAESFGDKPVPDAPLPEWAQPVLAAPPAPHFAPPSADWILPNGLRLIVRPVHQTHTILLRGRIHENTDLEEPSGQEGVGRLTAGLLPFGTATRDRIATEAAVEDLGSRADLGASFGLAAQTADFGATLALLADTELHPAFREGDLAIVRDKFVRAQRGFLQTPGHAFSRAIRSALVPKDDPTLREATPETIGRLTRNDVVAYFRRVYRPDMTVIEIIGDIEPQAARAAVLSAFGDWTAEGPKPDVTARPIPDPPVANIQMDGEGRTQDRVFLMQTLALRQGTAETTMFDLGNAVLGRGFSSRLFQALRGSSGYVYTVGSTVSTDRTRGMFSIALGADPAKVPRVKAEILSILDDMCHRPVGVDELGRVRAGYLRTMPFADASLDAIALRDVGLATRGLPLDQPDRNIAAVQAATPERVRDLFARTLRPKDLSTFIYGPAPP
ncbi:M16 family metallopeptidase [Gluconacetobacter liquefaciens]|uniref:Insulinase family protein n=1 Tax=Gluconacetobacter liquefaciens TaxID=89584 RepID=A0A370GA27_GLULI|nr:pitrilysin family protein [Gluconacetobacter liquefaciens]MBB2185258.1 insulinase family protein [Gluconacetobacter liquefaciens]RDI40692.1 zinc protease [Gluconacetobacter liquefaciens]